MPSPLRSVLKAGLPVLFILFSLALFAKTDSLLRALRTARTDTARVDLMNELCLYLVPKGRYEQVLLYMDTVFALSEKNGYRKGTAYALNNLGNLNRHQNNYTQALHYFTKALDELGPLNDKAKISAIYGNIGAVYKEQSNFSKSLEYHFKALRLAEELKDERSICRHMGNIGSVYREQGDAKTGITYLKRALEMSEKLDDQNKIAVLLGQIGVSYENSKNYPKALEYYFRALQMDEKNGNRKNISAWLGNIGIVYDGMNDHEKAETYYLRAITLSKELGDKDGLARHYTNLGSMYHGLKRYSEAGAFLNHALELAREIGYRKGIRNCYQELSSLYATLGKYAEALENYKLCILYRDSLANEENTKKIVQAQMQYEFDKQQTADSIRNAEVIKQEALKHDQEIRQQRIYTYGGALGFVLMLVVAGVSFRAFRQKQKANLIISEQKQLAELKQKEILDSIHYAKRIQQSLFPSEKYIQRQLGKRKDN